MNRHKPVLLDEAIQGLAVSKGKKYVDCNLGAGGHTEAVLQRGGVVLGMDVDKYAVKIASTRLSRYIKNGTLIIRRQNFKDIDVVVKDIGWSKVSGILYDLGLSTFQLKEEDKGFSFNEEVLMDMRMDDSLNVTANDLLIGLTEKELGELFFRYGEEPQARKFASLLKAKLKTNPSGLTAKAVGETIKKATRSRYRYSKSRIHPATRVFQAFRIAVNSELENLQRSLEVATSLLETEGRLVIISFHALEDKIAKNLARSPRLRRVNKKPVTPSSDEVMDNPSSRSAKLRIYEKV